MLSKIVRKIYGSYISVVNIEGTINNIMYFYIYSGPKESNVHFRIYLWPTLKLLLSPSTLQADFLFRATSLPKNSSLLPKNITSSYWLLEAKLLLLEVILSWLREIKSTVTSPLQLEALESPFLNTTLMQVFSTLASNIKDCDRMSTQIY